MKVKEANTVTILLQRMRSRCRVFFGFCPMCNSDAPAIYNCPLCDGYRTFDNGLPSSETKAKWLNDYDTVLAAMARTRKLVERSRRNTKDAQ